MEFLGMDNDKGELVESSLHSNPSRHQQEDNKPGVIYEECYKFFYKECNHNITNSIFGGFELDFRPPIYD